MKKKIMILLCSLLLSISLVGYGCSESNNNEKDITTEYIEFGDREFLRIRYGDDYGYVYVDVETKVQYLQFGAGQSARIVVLVDAEGKPILYEGSLE